MECRSVRVQIGFMPMVDIEVIERVLVKKRETCQNIRRRNYFSNYSMVFCSFTYYLSSCQLLYKQSDCNFNYSITLNLEYKKLIICRVNFYQTEVTEIQIK